jgi:hypothetical protein
VAINTVKAIINGTEYTLTWNGTTGKYEASVVAPASSSFNLEGGYYPVSITAIDVAGNSATITPATPTIGGSLKLIVKEKVKPVITIIAPAQSGTINTATPTVTVQLRDVDSGVKISTLALKINGGAVIGNTATGMTVTPVTGGYDISYVVQNALLEGSNTITVDVQDNDGNTAVQASTTFTVAVSAPSLTVSSPVNNLVTKIAALTVSGVTNDNQLTGVIISIKLNSVDQGAVTLNTSTGAFSKALTLANGVNTIVVKALDAGGLSTEVTRTVTLDTAAPVFQSVTIIPNPADAGATFIISVSVTD